MTGHRIVRFVALLCLVAIADSAAADERMLQAAARGDVAAVRQLLRDNVDVNAADADGTTAAALGRLGRGRGHGRGTASRRRERLRRERVHVTPLSSPLNMATSASSVACSMPVRTCNTASTAPATRC